MIKTESRELGGRKCKYVGDISMDGNWNHKRKWDFSQQEQAYWKKRVPETEFRDTKKMKGLNWVDKFPMKMRNNPLGQWLKNEAGPLADAG